MSHVWSSPRRHHRPLRRQAIICIAIGRISPVIRAASSLLAELDSLRCPLHDLGNSGKPLTSVGKTVSEAGARTMNGSGLIKLHRIGRVGVPRRQIASGFHRIGTDIGAWFDPAVNLNMPSPYPRPTVAGACKGASSIISCTGQARYCEQRGHDTI